MDPDGDLGDPYRSGALPDPDLVLVYESGTIGAEPYRIPLSIGDGELTENADAVLSVPKMFNYWIGPGRIDVAFLGAAQVDRMANLNLTVIGDYDKPKTRLPGAGGAPEIAPGCGVLEPDPETKELTLTRLHPGIEVDAAREATGWELAVAAHLDRTEEPDAEELEALRELLAR